MAYLAELQSESKYLYFYWTKKIFPKNYYSRENNLTNQFGWKCDQANFFVFSFFIIVKTRNIKFAIFAILKCTDQ